MSILTNANEFLKNSDFPFDKVVYMYEGSFTVGALSSATDTVAHNLPFIPLPVASWSTSVDFSVSYEVKTGPQSNGNFIRSIDCQANATNTIITGYNGSGSSQTFYYRLYAFEPSDENELVGYTASSGTNYIVNTDYNYSKLYAADVFSQGAVGGSASTVTVNHNLGYYPQVMVWKEISGTVEPFALADLVSPGDLRVSESTSSVSFTFQNSLAMRVHYRIYTDVNE